MGDSIQDYYHFASNFHYEINFGVFRALGPENSKIDFSK